MRKIIYKAALSLCLATTVTLSSCELNEYNPSAILKDETLTTFSGWKGMQSTCYTPLTGYLANFEYLFLAEGGTDLWVTGWNRTWAQELNYYEGLTTNTGYTNKVFTYLYSMIGTCNTIIDSAAGVEDGDSKVINQLVAETRCLRGYYYSVLVTHYGPITLKLREEKKADTNPKRNSIEEIYSAIIDDLKFAAENLEATPYDKNYARCSQKTALGLMARAYAQGAGEGLQEEGKSYWQRAKEVSEDLIANAAGYGAYLYDDVADLWAQANNRNNKEALFMASGLDPYDASAAYAKQNNILSFTFCNPFVLSDVYLANDKANYFYGRINNNVIAPSKYLIDCFDATYDKRWENSFVTAFANFSLQKNGWATYANRTVTLTENICTKYGIDSRFIGKKIVPYAEVDVKPTPYKGNQYPASIWPKGEYSGDPEKTVDVKNVYVHPYPLAKDEDRFVVYLSKEYLSDAEKAERGYICVNIDDLFDSENMYKPSPFDANRTNTYQLFPSLSKYNWNYDGAFVGSNLQYKNGDIALMRMAEVYLIAAEANMQLGEGGKAAEYLNVLRKRACRNEADYDTHMKLTTATQNDIFDEYARELCGEYSRWALLKRHKAFEERLKGRNPRAAKSFTAKNYLRPISYDFLSQIDNQDEYGTNGY